MRLPSKACSLLKLMPNAGRLIMSASHRLETPSPNLPMISRIRTIVRLRKSARRRMQKPLLQWKAWPKMLLMKICLFLTKKVFPLTGRGTHPVLCVAGRSLIDEAAAIMLGQPSTAHGLAARVEAAEALSTANVFRLETTGVAIICLVYMDATGPAHMRYSVRRLRRKIPKAIIILGCWIKEMNPAALEQLREGAKADLAAANLGEAVKLCIEATGAESQGHEKEQNKFSATTAA